LNRGGVAGYGGAAMSGASLYNNLYGNNNGSAIPGVGAAGNVLGIYNGLRQGGVAGYGGAALNTAQLAGLGGSYIPYIGAALGAYNVLTNSQSGRTGSDALQGAESGAAIGTGILPGIGTVVGGLIGGAVGAIASAFGPGAKDPEDANFGNYTKAFNQGGPAAVAQATPAQAFQSLAGLFDLRSGQIKGNIPMYQQYGRMGEGKFTTDMASQINSAIASGKISKTATPDQIYQQVVTPWMNSWGKGQLNDANAPAIQNLVQQLIGQWQSGALRNGVSVGVSGEKMTNLPTYGGGG
jgi:hypothetical protein